MSPQGGTITGIDTPVAGGLEGGPLNGGRASIKMRDDCSATQVLTWDGDSWECVTPSAGAGDIESVTAGNGLTGGGTSGAVTLDVACGAGLSCNANDVTLALAVQDCAAGSFFDSNTATGTFSCVAEVGDISGITVTAPIAGAASSGSAALSLTLCAANQIYKVNAGATAWACSADATGGGGITNSAGNNILTKSNGTNIVASSISDDGSLVTMGAALTTNGLNVGRDTSAATAAQNGWRVTPFSDGNVYLDSKTFTNGSTIFRTGEGAAVGTTTTWLTVDSTAGAATFSNNVSAVNITGTNAITANGYLNSLGFSYAYDGATYLANGTIGFGYNVNATATGYINAAGYANGITQFRNLNIQDGKGADVVSIVGSSKLVTFAGQATVVGGVLISGGGLTVSGGTAATIQIPTALESTVTLGDSATDLTSLVGKLQDDGTPPSVSSCGTGASILASTAGSMAWTVVTGTGASSCTVTFPGGGYNAPATCQVQRYGSHGAAYVSAVSANDMTFDDDTGIVSGTFTVICIGH